MKVYLVNPLFHPTIWSFEGLQPFTGTRFLTTPLGLATVAALTPKHWEVEIVDENVESIDFDGFTEYTPPGIRAQLLDKTKSQLVEDFVIEGDNKSVHVLNAVSPAFTCALPFSAYIVANYVFK